MESDTGISTSITEAAAILDAVDSGENILIHAPGGTGKTYLLRTIAERYTLLGKKVATTAFTGVAAMGLTQTIVGLWNEATGDDTVISGTTLHSWAGVGLGKNPPQKLVTQILKYPQSRAKWLLIDILIIDEISMVGGGFLDKLDYVAQRIRRNKLPFGGIQLILSGDFLQLPPIKEKWAFQSVLWGKLNLSCTTLTSPQRYPDLDWFNLLLRIRKATHTKSDIAFLTTRVKAYQAWLDTIDPDDLTIVKPTMLYSRKIDVETENQVELKKLHTPEQQYTGVDLFTPFTGNRTNKDHYESALDDAIPSHLVFKVGAQVMLKANLDLAMGLANGSRGVIISLTKVSVTVKWMSGMTSELAPRVWTHEDSHARMTRTQIPLILAYALTVHKTQGVTLDYAIVNLGPTIFSPGQAYVALSRVRSPDGLLLEEFYPNVIKADPDALAFVESIEATNIAPTFSESDLMEYDDSTMVDTQEIVVPEEEELTEVSEEDDCIYILNFVRHK